MDNGTQSGAPAPTPSSGDQALQAATQQVTQPHTALPAPMPQMPQRIERASGLLGMLTADITNAYANHKEKKIKDAMANYMTYANAHTRAEDMVNKSGVTDPAQRQQMMQKFVAADPSVVALFSGKNGEKNVKAMRDLLKVDFSDPESMNTVQHQALQRVTKALGAQKVMAMIGSLRQQHAQQGQQQGQPGLPGALGAGGQLNQQPTDPGARNVAARAESQATPLPTDVKGATEIATSEANIHRARAEEERAKYEAARMAEPKGANFQNSSGQNFWGIPDAQGKIHLDSVDGPVITGAVKSTAGMMNPDKSAFSQWKQDPKLYDQFQKEMAAAKQTAAKNASFMSVFSVYKMMEMAYKDNPDLLPMVASLAPQVFAKAGLNMPPSLTAVLGEVPTGQPLSPTTGSPIGLSMPGAPTTLTKSSAQAANRFLSEMPRVTKEVQDLAGYLGPVEGRKNIGFLLGKVGTTGDPDTDKKLGSLRSDIKMAQSLAARFHLQSVRALEELQGTADAGKDTAPVILGAFDSLGSWAKASAAQIQGKGETGAAPSGAGPAKVSDLVKKYGGQ